MNTILRILGGLLLLLILAALIVPSLISKEWLKAQIETNATTALGRDVTVGEVPALALLPSARVSVRDLTIGNAEGFDAPHLISVESADISVALLPLLTKTIEIKGFSLDGPDIQLQSKADGSANWVLGTPTEPSTDAPEGSGALPVSDVKLGTVTVNDATVSFDNGTGTVYQATDADLSLTLNSLTQPMTLKGDMIVQGEASALNAKLDTPAALLAGDTATLALMMTVGENTAESTLTLTDGITFEGDLDVDVPALRALIALTGNAIDTPNGFERVRLVGPVAGNAERFEFRADTKMTFDNIEGEGPVTIDLSGTRPKVTGNLTVADLDLRPYLPEETEGAASAGFPAWSTEAMDFSALTEMDAEISFAAEAIRIPNITIGKSQLKVVANAGRATATLEKMALYEGTGSGTVTLDARRQGRAGLSADLTLSSVNVGAFAQDAINLSRLAGAGDVTIKLQTTGASQADWVNALDGTVTTSLSDGRIEGVNLGKIARGALQAYNSLTEGGINVAGVATTLSQLSAGAQGEAEATDFTGLNLAMTIRDGVVTSDQLSLTGPYFEIAGDAIVNLPNQEMRMTLTPKVSAIEGETQRALPTPILVSGTFNAPKVGVDANGLVRSQATKGLTDILKKQGVNVPDGASSVSDVLSGAATEELGKLLGGSSDDGEDSDDNRDAAIEQGLNLLFGGSSKEDSSDGDE